MTFEHEHINENRFSDSAGTPWAGREFDVNNFAGDDGSAPAPLIAALKKFQNGEALAEDVIDAIRQSRLLIPLLANLGESEVGAHGHKVDKSAELSIVTVATPDDQNGLPVFSSVAAMQKWNPIARPVPADARRVALAAAAEENTRIILDPENETEFAIRRPAIAAIAQGLNWVHPARNLQVFEELKRIVQQFDHFMMFELQDCDPQSRLHSAELMLVMTLSAGLSQEEVAELMQRFAVKLGESELVAEHVDSLRVKLA
jgi:hypothetical protein